MTKKTASSTGGVVALSTVIATTMIAQQIATKAVRDGFFLTQLDVTMLPLATLAAAALSFVTALFIGKFISSFTPAAAVPVLFGLNGVLFAVEASLVDEAPRAVAGALFLHTAAFGGAVVSGFWSVVNERFDPYTARRVMGQIAGGATFGGVLGGALTWALADVSMRWLLVGFAGTSFLCGLAISAVGRSAQSHATPDAAPRDRNSGKRAAKTSSVLDGFRVLIDNRYPRTIAALVFLSALTLGIADYVFKAGVAAQSESGSLVGFFAVFYTGTGVVTFVVQATASKSILKSLGVVPTVALLPGTLAVLLVLTLVSPIFLMLVLLRSGAMVVENSLYRSGYELLYTAVPKEQKRSAKVLIDLGCDRLGTAAASGLALLVIALAAAAAVQRALLVAAVFGCVLIALVIVAARREYVASLASQLRGALGMDSVGPASAERAVNVPNAAQRLASTFVADADVYASEEDLGRSEPATFDMAATPLSRAELLEAVQARVEELSARPAASCRVAMVPRSEISEDLLTTPIRERLRRARLDDLAWQELVQSAPGLVGQLGDLLLSPREDLFVRLRAGELLATVPTARSAAALEEALVAPELRLRRAAALGLLAISAVAPSLKPSKRKLTTHAVDELRRPSRPVGARTRFEETSPFIRDARGNELDPSLELVLLLLAIRGDTSQLRLALLSITSDDPNRRGTGLEYLDNLLPGEMRSRLLALAEHPELTRADQRLAPRARQQLADQLRCGDLSIGELRARFRELRKAHYDGEAPVSVVSPRSAP